MRQNNRFNSGGRSGGFGRGRVVRTFNDEAKFIKKAVAKKAVEEFAPEHNFVDFDIDARLKENILSRGFEKPTPIQDRSIPQLLEGRDLIGLANTGTGKTAAFLIPLLNKVLKNRQEKVLIIAPTRELAEQINAEFLAFSKGLRIFSVTAVGGMNIRPQIMSLKHGVNFVIGTPGRLTDLVNRKYLRLDGFTNVVLDEADRMLDMGFVPDIRGLFAKLPTERQTVFFSATFPREVESLTSEFLKDPIRIEAKTGDTAENVDQDVVRFDRHEEKMDILHNLLLGEDFKKVLIFGETKHGVENVSLELSDRGFKAMSIHGDKSQRERRVALRLFKEERIKILVATDVAARGIDVPDVSHVINFDLPHTYEDYIHRIGRTGRASRMGKALTFVKKRSEPSGSSYSGRSERGGFRKPSGSSAPRRRYRTS